MMPIDQTQYMHAMAEDTDTGKPMPKNATEITKAPMLPMDKQAQLKTQIENNTTALGISASYTGASFDTMANGENYTWLTGFVRSDQAGNAYIQQSADGTNFYSTDTIVVSAGGVAKINIDILARYIRIYYVNGATAQGNFGLFAYATFK